MLQLPETEQPEVPLAIPEVVDIEKQPSVESEPVKPLEDDSIESGIESGVKGHLRPYFWDFFNSNQKKKIRTASVVNTGTEKPGATCVKVVLGFNRPKKVLYCDQKRKDPLFLMRYFNYTCSMCQRYTSHILTPQCCQHGVCHECSVGLQSCTTELHPLN